DKLLEIDSFNPTSAASLAKAFNQYKKLKESQQKLMRPHLDRILAKKDLSDGVAEIVTKILG
ncbi:MAG: aminopeptidase N C-terminal domain-containing protein, partial [Chloroflexota bacterium]|nr:aminopeptidase N C-terminal domain-containing protein [Chloroflexota bacterium]